MDEGELVVDSPDQSPVEDEDLSDVEDFHLDKPAKSAVKNKDAHRDQVRCCFSPRTVRCLIINPLTLVE